MENQNKDKKLISVVKNPFNLFFWHLAIVAALIAVELSLLLNRIVNFQTQVFVYQAVTPFLTLIFILMVNGIVKLSKDKVRLGNIFTMQRVEKWENLIEVSVAKLKPRRSQVSIVNKKRDFIILKFDGCKEELSDTLYLVNSSAHVIAIMLTKRNKRILSEYLPERFKECLE